MPIPTKFLLSRNLPKGFRENVLTTAKSKHKNLKVVPDTYKG